MILQIRYLVPPGSILVSPIGCCIWMIMTWNVYIDVTLHIHICSIIDKAIRGRYWLCSFMYILQRHQGHSQNLFLFASSTCSRCQQSLVAVNKFYLYSASSIHSQQFLVIVSRFQLQSAVSNDCQPVLNIKRQDSYVDSKFRRWFADTIHQSGNSESCSGTDSANCHQEIRVMFS